MHFTALIFDFDGLLADSEPTWKNVHATFLERHGVEPTQKRIHKTLGRGLQDTIVLHKNEHGLTGDTKELTQEFRGMFYEEYLKGKQVKLMPGADSFVKAVFEKGYVLAVATGGHAKKDVEEMLRKASLLDYFTEVISSDMVEKGKPDPQVFLFTAERLAVDPAACLVFEDSPNGVVAGKKAGMKVIAINPSLNLREALDRSKADRVYASFDEIEIDRLADI